MRIFLTGGTGYLGVALSRRLVEAGHELRALVRETSEVGPLRSLGVSTFVGDVTDRISMREGMSGADWVIHAAAVVDFRESEEKMRAVNVGGSENVASLAYKLGVPRFLSVSSVAYFGGSPPDGSRASEEGPVQLPLPTGYSRTKHEGQRRIETWARQGLALNTVYPSLVYGPPGKMSGVNALLGALLRERFPALIGGDRWTSWVFLDDVIDGMIRILRRAEPGEEYLFAGDVARVREVVDAVCSLGGVDPPGRELSARRARWILRLLGPVLRLLGRRIPVNREQIETLSRHWAFDDRRAREKLEWTPRPLERGLPETVEFLDRSREAA